MFIGRCGGGNSGSEFGESGSSGSSGNGGRGGGLSWGCAVAGSGESGDAARVWVRYEVHLPAFSLRVRENLCTILAGRVLPTAQGHVLCKN